MLYWITYHLATIAVAIVLAIIVVFVIRHLINNKIKEKFSCGCNCDSCPYASGDCLNRKTE